MNESSRTLQVDTLLTELWDATAREAVRDAELTAKFLNELGFLPSSEHPIAFPPAFLLQLGAALRLWVWESSGLRIHRVSGLPSADQAIIKAFSLLDDSIEVESKCPVDLARTVVALFAERFAWHGRSELNADIVLDDTEDEVALDALARFLWDTRDAKSRAFQSDSEVKNA